MAENRNIEVGGRLHSIATGNVLAGANEILDDSKNKKQSDINAETDVALEDRYTKAETYSKTQLDNMITTPEIAYKDYDTYADMVAETNHPAGAIYRVANYDGTQAVTNKYAEYSWDGTQYKLMAVRDHGIDDEPTVGSNNLVKSGGAFDAINRYYKKEETLQLTFNQGKLYNITNGQIVNISGPYAYSRFVPSQDINYIIATGYQSSSDKYAFLTFFDNEDNILYSLNSPSTTFSARKVDIPNNTAYGIINVQGNDYSFIGAGLSSLQEKVEEYATPIIEEAIDNIPEVSEENEGLAPAKKDWDDIPQKGSDKIIKNDGVFYGINEPYFIDDGDISLTDGRAYNITTGEIIVSPSNSYAKINMIEGLAYIIATGTQSESHYYPLIAFFNEEDVVISKVDLYNNTSVDVIAGKPIAIPEGTSYIVINANNNSIYKFTKKLQGSLQGKVVEYATPIVKELSDNFLQDGQAIVSWGNSNQLYNVNTGQVVNNIPNAIYGRGVITSDNKYISVTGMQHSSSAYTLLTFFDENNEKLNSIDQPGATVTNATLEVPANASYFIVNFNTSVDYNVTSTVDTSKEVAQLPSAFEDYILLNNINVVNGSLKHTNGNIVTVTNGAYCVINVEGLSEVYVSGWQHGSTNYPIIAFYDSNDTLISYFGQANKNFVKQQVVVPNNAVTAVMDFIANIPFGCYIKDLNAEQKKEIFYQIGTDEIYVSTKYGEDKDLKILLCKKTINQYFDFTSFHVMSNSEKYPIDIHVLASTFGTGSDFHGPFIVRAVNNVDGDAIYSHHYTGGAHAYNNNYVDGTPTMRCVNLKFYIDGRIVSSAEKGYCRNIRITWTNFVQGYNTKKADGSGREILQENHELLFDGVKWHSYVEIIALEDIVFEKYYGFQYGGMGVYTKVRYADGANKLEYNVTDGSYSGDEKCSMIRSYGTEHEIILTLDTLFGLGKREYFEWEGRGALTQTYGKGYFYVICGPDNSYGNCPLNTGEMLVMRGTYQFIPNMIYAQ